jgi:intracellular multiplication protein IcmQ
MTFNLSSLVTVDFKNEELKRHLVECVTQQKQTFVTLAEEFYHLGRRTDADYYRLCRAVIDAVDQVLASSDWDASLFLHNTLKPLRELREHALQLLENMGGENAADFAEPAVAADKVKLYISLYQTNGHDLKQWAAQLGSLSSYIIGRPIYQTETEVVTAIRAKLSQLSEAYVVVAVDPEKIINDHQASSRKDRFGQSLISLLPHAIDSDRIIKFVHQGKSYIYRHQQLMPLTVKRGNA